MLPNDINMLVSFLNTKLRDDDMSLEHLLEINDADVDVVMKRLQRHGFIFDKASNQIKVKQDNLFCFFKCKNKRYFIFRLEVI